MLKIYEYRWKAINRFGQRRYGKSLSITQENLEQQLIAKGYQQIKLIRNFTLTKRVKPTEITQLLTQLALLLDAAIPLKQALAMLLENCDRLPLYQWLYMIIENIEKGFSFSTSLEKSGKYLQLQEIQLIKMGEISGNLPVLLSNLAQARNKSEKLTKKIKKIMFYPAIVLAISMTLAILLLLFIVPQFVALYGDNDSLPIMTKILFYLSQFLQHSIIYLIIALSFTYLIAYFINKKTAYIQKIIFKLLSVMPLFKNIINQSRIIYFCQNCALMLNAHIRLDKALTSFLSEKTKDPILQQEVQFSLQLLEKGFQLSDGLNPHHFNAEVIQMIRIGEKSSQLVKMFESITTIYQQKLDHQIDLLSQLLEPMLMLILGIIVGSIIIGLYLPIFDMGTMVK
ncbi:protein transport protein HofC [Nicoletella semolina]|uniref:Protein transport protein HofC n=1 Tax=Nicoletella semolina TaxID=271160 RepID=A0A4R2NCM5_9PAST|nr:type II secretion system F family protein [Nicoletella semolina]MDH2924153.1 fimbrial protein [Nicoletella semolina]TCP18951.1 protein transport protein HofC [Nicoletella semolina]